MDEAFIKTSYPKYWSGFKKVSRGYPKKDYKLIAYDTETCYGEVFALAFFDGDRLTSFHGLDKPYLTLFLEYLEGQTANRGILVSAHYQKFDLGVLFYPLFNRQKWQATFKAPQECHFSMLFPRCEIRIFFGQPCFAKIKFPRHHRSILLIDTYAFTTTSLEKSLEGIGSPVKKLPKPKDLGKRVIPKKELMSYLEADVKGEYNLLKFVDNLCKSYDAKPCYSLPMLAGWIFRHRFMQKSFKKPHAALLSHALLSYHGGKNTFCGKQGWYDAYDLDIRSAYPEAMRQLPDFENGAWVYGEGVKFLDFNPHGIYRVTGHLKPCPWGSIFSHGFKKLTGSISRISSTGYEILESLHSGELTIDYIDGWGFKENDDASKDTAFARFVDEFYKLKETAPNKAMRDFYKLAMNAISGKAISRIQNLEGKWVAGSMFDPTIASLITGFIRAKVHRLEHKYDALHTATDGLITRKKPDAKDLGEAMGKLKLEVYGKVLILRNKLYLHYDEAGVLKKKGLHGFQGSADDLLKMMREDRKYYTTERLVSWAESWHIKLPPGTPIKQKRILKF